MRPRHLAVLSASLLALPVLAVAQVHRADWSASGPREGREPADERALTSVERRHVPVLTMPQHVRSGRSFDLVVQVGVEPHTMTHAHHIDWIEVTVDDAPIFISDLSEHVAFPVVRVPMRMTRTGTLTARAHCTLHGVWRTRRSITVRP